MRKCQQVCNVVSCQQFENQADGWIHHTNDGPSGIATKELIRAAKNNYTTLILLPFNSEEIVDSIGAE